LIPNPIHKVLSTMHRHHVQCLLMGGQACVFYGAAEFSRDTDLALLSEADNLARLQTALEELQAECIAIPPFEPEYLTRGHAIHFRCHHPDAEGMRIDIMSVMRGVAPFPDLWARRTTLELDSGEIYELLSLEDLVQAKKTQRDKDWPMIRRLVESHHVQNREHPAEAHIQFWLRECRTSSQLIALAREHSELASSLAGQRPLLLDAIASNQDQVGRLLEDEERRERELDRAYWLPLKRELEQLRRLS
jgi:hypothetical protein